MLVFGSKLTWFYYGDRNLLVYCAGIRTDKVFVWGSKITWISCLDRNCLGLCGDRTWLDFCLGIDLVLVEVEIDFILE